jgi:ferric reductase like protein
MMAKTSRRTMLALCIILQYSLVLAFPEAPFSANSTTGSLASNATKTQNETSSNSSAAAADKAAKASASKASAWAQKKREDNVNMAVVRGVLYFWLGLLGLFTVSLFCLVFRRYLRTISSLSPGNTQAYFAPVDRHWGLFKKYFIFAPLVHKRHHRPFMLTRTIDNGCLPSRLQTSLLVGYFAILVFATFYDIEYDKTRREILTALTKRSGLLSLANMLPLFILAARNNPLIFMTGLSFDTYNLFHRWLGRFITIEVIFHGTTYIIAKVEKSGWAAFGKQVAETEFIRAGVIVRNFSQVVYSEC